jgi:PIN domain nuclease of toxin-antitoxin system
MVGIEAQVTYLDTHAFAALHRKELDRFSSRARRVMDAEDDIRISPMVALEIEFLYEIKRVKSHAEHVIGDLSEDLGLRVCDAPFYRVIRQASEERWTRDPFDRVIVAHARVQAATLVTLDKLVHEHYSRALA